MFLHGQEPVPEVHAYWMLIAIVDDVGAGVAIAEVCSQRVAVAIQFAFRYLTDDKRTMQLTVSKGQA